MSEVVSWIEIYDYDPDPIGAIGFVGNKAVIVVSYYDDADGDRSGSVGWGEWIVSKLSPISLEGKAVTEVAMAARLNMDVLQKDASFQREASRMFVKFANSMIVDGVYAAYFSRLVGLGASTLSKKLVGGTVKQFVVRKGMEAIAGKAIKDAMKN